MHRQAMLVSLSLSPASTAAKNDKHWAFLDEIDAPQWADLKAEEALARLGTIGGLLTQRPNSMELALEYQTKAIHAVVQKDHNFYFDPDHVTLDLRMQQDDPWFYRSHSHHEVPLTEIIGGQAPDVKDPNAIVRTPHLERKKNRASSKVKLAFDGVPAGGAKSKESAKEDDSSPRAGYNSTFQDSISGADSPQIASPVHCKSPENFSTRRFATSAGSDDYIAGNGNDGAEVLRSSSFRVITFESQLANDQTSSVPGVPVSSELCVDEDKPSPPSTHWQETIFSKLKDTSRLRKSLGSALRVKIGDATENSSSKPPGAATRPKSRLRQSVQLEVAALPVVSGSDRNTKDTATLRNEDGLSSRKYKSERTSPGDTTAVTKMASKLGVNSSVQAFEDIRKMRKSWGSALRVKVNNDSPSVEDSSSEHEVSFVPPVSGDCDSDMVIDPPSEAEISTAGSEDKHLPAIDVTELVRAFERRTQNPREALDSVKELEVSSPKIVAGAAAGAVRKYRRSVSFDHTPGRGTDSKASTSNPSNPAQQKQGPRASSVSRLNAAAKADRVSHPSKGGKENTTLHSSAKTSKLNTEPSTGSPRMSRHTVTRTSMPSLTFVAHARAAMGANGGTILKPSGNGVVETNRSDSSKTAASAARKSAVWSDNGSRKKTEAPVTNAPAKTVSRQSILRSSMPVFSAAAAAKQASKPVLETGAAGFKQGGKNSSKIGNGDADLAALLAEHNRKFRPKPTYEPRIHSVKDIREWESRTGNLFYNLLPIEREKANQEISAAKQTQRPK